MIRTYTILSTNGELQTSPYIKDLHQKYDLFLSAHQPKVVNFLFQIPISRSDAHEVCALYDEDALEVDNIYVDCYHNQTLISTCITAKEVGCLKISFMVPDHLSLTEAKVDRMASGY
jgi:hypothetical protein